MEGWIKLHRQILENPIVMKDSDHLAVWIYLLLNATHKEYPVIFKGEKMTLKAGQLITGRKVISEKLGVSESKVKRILTSFENDQQIDRQRSNQNSLISICQWSSFQQDDQPNDQPVTSQRPASDQPVTTNKNVKNVKNVKNINKNIYGEFKNVLLSDDELAKLKANIPNYKEYIERLSEYMASKGKKYKSHYATILAWSRKEKKGGTDNAESKDNTAEPKYRMGLYV